jgi:hypothetical protein
MIVQRVDGREEDLMPKFRKKPVVVEAQHFDGTHASAGAILYWIGQSRAAREAAQLHGQRLAFVNTGGELLLRTLESGDGYHTASPGDWIVKGIHGEFYPIKPDIFAASYDQEPDVTRAEGSNYTQAAGN